MERAPQCPVFGNCGGCSMQERDYAVQIELKKKDLIADFLMQKVELSPELKVFVKQEFNYRNRMDFPFNSEGLGQRKKGHFEKLIHFKKCHIANTGVQTVFDEVQAWFELEKEKLDVFDVVRTTGTIRYATIRSSFFSGESSVTFILNANSQKIEEHKALIESFAAKSKVGNVLIGLVKHNTDQSATPAVEVIKGSAYISERLGQKVFNYHTQGFFQSNSAVLMDIIYFIKDKVGEQYDTLIDLYGGVGTLGISLMDMAKEVFIVDNNGLNTAAGAKNIEANDCKNVKFFEADAEKSSELGIDLTGKKTIFVLDPPRNGIQRKVFKYIKSTMPEKLIYVSCNPRRMAEDIKILSADYDLKDFAAFDMFPQTRHIEAVGELTKKII
ncbi:MAG: 23S rRNA (uracil(1939)-C(5))-methyltransferase RlmD [bacterium]